MGSNKDRGKIDAAMAELCSLFDSGELRASVDMAGFLGDVAGEVKLLRDLLGDAVDLAGGGCMPHDERLDTWKAALGGN